MIQAGQTISPITFGAATVTAATLRVPTAKVDTRLLIADATVSITADTSQRLTDLTAGPSGGAYEASTGRLNISAARRCVAVAFEAIGANAGTLVECSDTAGGKGLYRLDKVGTDVDVWIGDKVDGTLAALGAVPLPSISAAPQSFVIQCCTTQFRQPFTTLADLTVDKITEVSVYNATTEEWVVRQFIHGAVTPITAQHFALGGRWDGADVVDLYDGNILACRVGARFHTSTEAREDWAELSTPVATTGETEDPPISLSDKSVTLADDTEIAGPVYAYAGHVVTRSRQRLISPLVNEAYKSPPELSGFSPASLWREAEHRSATYTVGVPFLWRRPVPLTCNRVRVSVHAQVWTVGAAPSLSIIAASSSAPPGYLSIIGGTPIELDDALGTRGVDDGVGGLGGWVSFDADVRIARDSDGFTWLYLAFLPSDADVRWKVHAVTMDPLVYPVSGGFPLEIGP